MLRWTAVVLVLLAGTAHAGRSRFGWLFDTEVNPERVVEVQTWIQEEDGKGTPGEDETLLWWGPVIGLTDRLELAIPIEVTYKVAGGQSSTQIERFGVELRWRLSDPDPVESGPFAALVRVAAKRPVQERRSVRFEGDLVLSYDAGSARLLADAGVVVVIDDEGNHAVEAHPGAGVSFAVGSELRLGAEVTSELQLDNDDPSWIALGPNLAYAHGRFWLAAAFLVGVRQIDLAPRLLMGIAF